MNRLEAGFARLDITPPMGIEINGYFNIRKADGILDPLEASCIALSCGETVELMKLVIAGLRSREEGGREIFLDELQV